MKINIKQEYLDLDGHPFYNDAEKKQPVNFAKALRRCAMSEVGTEKITAEQKLKQFDLLKKISTADNNNDENVDITAEDIALLKKNAATEFSVQAYGIFCNLLEQS